MAYKLIEWYDASRFELRIIFEAHGIVLEELCHECNTVIEGIEIDKKDNTPRCKKCMGPYARAAPGMAWLDKENVRVRGRTTVATVATAPVAAPVAAPSATWNHWAANTITPAAAVPRSSHTPVPPSPSSPSS